MKAKLGLSISNAKKRSEVLPLTQQMLSNLQGTCSNIIYSINRSEARGYITLQEPFSILNDFVISGKAIQITKLLLKGVESSSRSIYVAKGKSNIIHLIVAYF